MGPEGRRGSIPFDGAGGNDDGTPKDPEQLGEQEIESWTEAVRWNVFGEICGGVVLTR